MNRDFGQPESRAAEAIFRTLLYGDIFSFPMTEAEIHHFLIEFSASRGDVQRTLDQSAWLAERIERVNGYCAIRDRAETAQERHRRDTASQRLWPLARRCGILLAHLPFIRMVALTGALAMRNANDERDDIDYLLVTVAGRVWIARAFAVLVVRLARLLGIHLCPNYVLSETALVQSRQDLFMAHELAQMVPLAGLPIYDRMRAANDWSAALLPNAQEPFYYEPDRRPRRLGHALQWIGELLLSGPLGDALERWEQRRKMRKFSNETRKPGSAAQIDDQRVKGHFNDYGYPALDHYRERLANYTLNEEFTLTLDPRSKIGTGEPIGSYSPSLLAEKGRGDEVSSNRPERQEDVAP